MGDLYTGVASAIGAKKQRKQMQPLINEQVDLAHQAAQNAHTLSPYIGEFYSRTKEGFDPAFAYYKSLASGDRSKIMSAVAPQLDDVNSRYGSLISASRELSPRSGAGAGFNADMMYRAADEQQRIVGAERATAYPNLVKMAGLAGDLGAGAAGYATNAGVSANGLLTGAMNSGRGLAADQAEAYGQIARGLYDAYKRYGSSNGKGGTTAAAGAGTIAADSPLWSYAGMM